MVLARPFRKTPFGVGLESPDDSSDQGAFVSASANLAEKRFESLGYFGDRPCFEASGLGCRSSVHG
jgi:hypothetical protein